MDVKEIEDRLERGFKEGKKPERILLSIKDAVRSGLYNTGDMKTHVFYSAFFPPIPVEKKNLPSCIVWE